MTDRTPAPNTPQITIWRNLLDAFGQLSAAWQAAAEAQRAAEAGKGPGAIEMPESLVAAFARACEAGADTLTGVATVLSQQAGNTEAFASVAETQRTARDHWETARQALHEAEES